MTPARAGGPAPAASPSSFALPSFAPGDAEGEEDSAAVFATPEGRGDEDNPPLTPAEAAAEAAAEAYLAQSTPRPSNSTAEQRPLAPLALSPAEQADTSALRWTPPQAPPLLLATPASAFPLPQLPPSRRLPVFRPPQLSPPRVAQLPPPRDSHLKAAQRRVTRSTKLAVVALAALSALST